MLPEERACYIDLLIYQHQNGGYIPNDLKRVLMYCSGCNEATLQATLQAKFKLCDKGWYNETMERVVSERQDFKEKQSVNGTVGQFFKKAKKILTQIDYSNLRQLFENQTNEEIFLKIKDLEINEATLQALLKALHKHLEDANAIEDEDLIYFEKGGVGEKTFEDFRKKYPGTKGGFEIEFKNFKTKHSDFSKVVKLLCPALEKQIEYRIRAKSAGVFCPEWKHLKTWINNRCWEDEMPKIETTRQNQPTTKAEQDHKLRVNSGTVDLAEKRNQEYLEKQKAAAQ